MDSNFRLYDYEASFKRLDSILKQPQGAFEEVDSLPDRDKLTYENGYYAYCSALFVDIRESSSLPSIYQRPALAKLYRAFLSEMVAVFNGITTAREINIVGDCVWGVYNTPSTIDIDNVFSLAYTGNSLVKVLNYKLSKAGYTTPIRVGFGASYGRTLMIKAGYSGSGISDVVYMGDVVNQAAKLAAMGGKASWSPSVFVDDAFHQNLKEHNQGLLQRQGYTSIYAGSPVRVDMEEWYNKNCQ